MKKSAIFMPLWDAGGVETDIATGEVTALKHKLRDHPMELGATVAEALLTGAQGTEVLSGLGSNIIVKIEVDTAGLVYIEVSHCSMRRGQHDEEM